MSKELVAQETGSIQQPFRTITLWSQRDGTSAKVKTDAITWGQLKEQNRHDFDFENVRGVIRETKNALEIDDALLPTNDCLIFLFPLKVNSGMRTKAEYEKSFGYKALRSMCSKQGLGTSGSKKDFVKRLVDHDLAKAVENHEIKPDIVRESVKDNEPLAKVVPDKAKTPTTAIAPTPANTGFATVEQATVTTTMTVRINDVGQLSSLLNVMFPGMEVVNINALVDLTATLKLASVLPAGEKLSTEVMQEVPFEKSTSVIKKAPKKSKVFSDKDLNDEANDLLKSFK